VFVWLRLSGQTAGMAFLYGVLRTILAEELLFRSLIAGSLARRLPAARSHGLTRGDGRGPAPQPERITTPCRQYYDA
jgi:hypothetical protein